MQKLSIDNEIEIVKNFGRKYDYNISEFENNFYINKLHPCGIPESIFCGSYQECKYYLNILYGQNNLFEMSALESDIDPILDDYDY